MDESNVLVGRLAQLHSILSKPELNDRYVMIKAYLPDKNRFSVNTLLVPNKDDCIINISVKLESLKLCSEDHFFNKYPYPRTVHVASLQDSLRAQPDGTVLDLITAQPSTKPCHLLFTKSHRIVGAKAALDGDGVPDPLTKINGWATFRSDEEDAVLQFEDICFTGVENVGGLFTCDKWRKMTFRRCSFHNILVIVAGEDDRLATPNVVFETCFFNGVTLTAGDATGLAVDQNGVVTLLNCFFYKFSGTGVSVNGAGSATLIHCSFLGCLNGVGTKANKAGSLTMLNCNLSAILQCGILIDEAGPIIIRGCKVHTCGKYGIYICGRDNYTSHLHISESNISNCSIGIGFRIGRVNACIDATSAENNSMHGLSVYQGVLGVVKVQRSCFAGNKKDNIQNSTCKGCVVTVDDRLLEATPVEVAQPTHLFARRCYQQAGLCYISCMKCGRKEEPGEKFKKCGQCEDVCYCSRECQKAHWKEHKKECEERRDAWNKNTLESLLKELPEDTPQLHLPPFKA